MTDSEKAEPIRIKTLGGHPTPEGVADDLRLLNTLPAQAQATFWRALGPSLDHPITPAAEKALDAFAKAHELDGDLLARPIRAMRFLVREAVRRGVDAASFGGDLDTITGGDEVTKRIALAGYDRALSHLRGQFAGRAMRAHGDVLTQVEWRLDHIAATPEADPLDIDVAHIALELEGEGGSKRVVRMQADLGQVRALRAACDAIESAARRRAR